MKKSYSLLVALFMVAWMCTSCKKKESFTICADRCPVGTPWKVESLDLGLPCFATQSDCIQWASTHGYSDKPCVLCD